MLLLTTLCLLSSSVLIADAAMSGYSYPHTGCHCHQTMPHMQSPYAPGYRQQGMQGMYSPMSSAPASTYGYSPQAAYGYNQQSPYSMSYNQQSPYSTSYNQAPMGQSMYPGHQSSYYQDGYKIKPKTSFGYDPYSGGLHLRTKYKMKPVGGAYPPVYATPGSPYPPPYVQSHPMASYGAVPPMSTAGYSGGYAAGYGQHNVPRSSYYSSNQNPGMSNYGYNSNYGREPCRW